MEPEIHHKKTNHLVNALAYVINQAKKRKKILLIAVIAILAVVVVGGGYKGVNDNLRVCNYDLNECKLSKTELKEENTLLETEKNKLTAQVTEINAVVDDYEQQVDSQESEISKLQKTSESCQEEFDTELTALNKQLDNATEELKEVKLNLTTLTNDYDFLSKSYAKDKCCPQYTFYAVISNNVLCCYQSGDDFICGAGLETPKEEISDIWCS